MYLFFSQIRQDKPSHRSSLPNDAQVTVVCATLPQELLEDRLQDILPVGWIEHIGHKKSLAPFGKAECLFKTGS